MTLSWRIRNSYDSTFYRLDALLVAQKNSVKVLKAKNFSYLNKDIPTKKKKRKSQTVIFNTCAQTTHVDRFLPYLED